MGNALPQRLSDDHKGKVILSDGTIHQYGTPLTVAELMLEYPQQVVVEFDQQTVSGKKPAPLPADKKLEMNRVYLMLPIKRGKPAALSSEESRRLLMTANTILKSYKIFSSFTGFVPLFARMCSAGAAQGPYEFATKQRNKRNMDADLKEEELAMTKSDPFAEILEGRPEFLSRQLSGKGWKPSLDTITEKNVNTKVRHWLFKNKFVLM